MLGYTRGDEELCRGVGSVVHKAIVVAVAATLVSAPAAQAGFLDFLFAPRKPVVAAPQIAVHPHVTMQPRAARSMRTGKPVKVAKSAKSSDRAWAVMTDPKEHLARTIDPVANPDWHLIDPTLRRGNVLVLTDRVLVFTGGRIGAPASYVSLAETRLVSKTERTRIAEMTGRAVLPPLLASKNPPQQPRLLRQASVMPPVLGSGPLGGS